MAIVLSRYFVFQLILIAAAAFAALGLVLDPWWGAPLVVLLPLGSGLN